jgi:hypothetical protein
LCGVLELPAEAEAEAEASADWPKKGIEEQSTATTTRTLVVFIGPPCKRCYHFEAADASPAGGS